VKGKLSAVLTFGESDRDRVNRYSRKHGVKPDQKVPWTVGRLVLHGWVAIKEVNISRGVAVGGVDAASILGIGEQDAPVSRRGNVALDYTLLKPPEIKAGPFWVTPSIAPGSEKHVLELDIQWPKTDPEAEKPPLLSLINLLRIEVPVKWGRVQEIDRGSPTVSAPSSDGGEWTRSIEWKQFSPSRAEREERQLTITVRFANPISAEHDLSGRLAATFNGSLSGVEKIEVFNALGNPRDVSAKPIVKTRVEADFKLSLASVRYQATRVFPDPETEDVDHSRSTDDFDVIPDGEAIIALSNTLAENQFYVKRITENPPRSGGRADVLHRYWNIAGRSYEGVHPTNFDVTITGEEVHRGDVRPESGNTKIRISVSGAYTNDTMRDRVDDTWSRLKELTAEAVEKARNSTARGPA
jgi:hypothetical protein